MNYHKQYRKQVRRMRDYTYRQLSAVRRACRVIRVHNINDTRVRIIINGFLFALVNLLSLSRDHQVTKDITMSQPFGMAAHSLHI